MNIKLRKLNYFFKAAEDDIGGGGDGANEGTGDDGSEGNENAWPDTWRETYAGEDEGKLAKLSRYSSPNAAFDAMISAQTKISSGEYKATTPFPDKGSEEEQTTWRTENGIPESADKYDMTFENGLVIGDDDKPIIDEFLNAAHAANMPPAQAKTAVEWYYQNQEKQAELLAESDTAQQTETEDALRAEWGNEYRANINRIHGLLDTAPERYATFDGVTSKDVKLLEKLLLTRSNLSGLSYDVIKVEETEKQEPVEKKAPIVDETTEDTNENRSSDDLINEFNPLKEYVKGITYTKADIKRELKWLKKRLPAEKVTLIEGLIAVGGKLAFGQTLHDSILLSTVAEEGTTYHEAFHRVVLSYLTDEQRTELYNAARTGERKKFTDYAIGEYLAEEFRKYALDRMEERESRGIIQKILDLFKYIYD